jgi:hypothetical protein
MMVVLKVVSLALRMESMMAGEKVDQKVVL